MRILICAALLAAGSVMAGDLVLKNKANGSELRLHDSPCVNAETLARLNEEWRGKFKAAKILNQKGHVEWFGCWIEHDEETAYILMQDGSQLMMELSRLSDPSV
jgi:hypothetical protein